MKHCWQCTERVPLTSSPAYGQLLHPQRAQARHVTAAAGATPSLAAFAPVARVTARRIANGGERK